VSSQARRGLSRLALDHPGIPLVMVRLRHNSITETTKRTMMEFVLDHRLIAKKRESGGEDYVLLHNGSKIVLSKLAEDYHPTDKMSALRLLHESAARGEYATGLIYVEPDKQDFVDLLGMVDEPLSTLPQSRTRPGQAVLDEIMNSFR